MSNDKIFTLPNGDPITFYIIPCKFKKDVSEQVVKHGGQMVIFRKDAMYQLYNPGDIVSDPNLVSRVFVEDCVRQVKLLNVEDYRYPVRHDEETRKKQDAAPQISQSEFMDAVTGGKLSNGKGKKYKSSSGTGLYTQEEDMAIIKAVLVDSKYHSINGQKLWQGFQKRNVTTRSSQSMKERFIKKILPFIHNYDLSDHEKKSLTMLESAKTTQVVIESGTSLRGRQPLLRLDRNDPYRISDSEMVIENCSSSDDDHGKVREKTNSSLASISASQMIAQSDRHDGDPEPSYIKRKRKLHVLELTDSSDDEAEDVRIFLPALKSSRTVVPSTKRPQNTSDGLVTACNYNSATNSKPNATGSTDSLYGEMKQNESRTSKSCRTNEEQQIGKVDLTKDNEQAIDENRPQSCTAWSSAVNGEQGQTCDDETDYNIGSTQPFVVSLIDQTEDCEAPVSVVINADVQKNASPASQSYRIGDSQSFSPVLDNECREGHLQATDNVINNENCHGKTTPVKFHAAKRKNHPESPPLMDLLSAMITSVEEQSSESSSQDIVEIMTIDSSGSQQILNSMSLSDCGTARSTQKSDGSQQSVESLLNTQKAAAIIAEMNGSGDSMTACQVMKSSTQVYPDSNEAFKAMIMSDEVKSDLSISMSSSWAPTQGDQSKSSPRLNANRSREFKGVEVLKKKTSSLPMSHKNDSAEWSDLDINSQLFKRLSGGVPATSPDLFQSSGEMSERNHEEQPEDSQKSHQMQEITEEKNLCAEESDEAKPQSQISQQIDRVTQSWSENDSLEATPLKLPLPPPTTPRRENKLQEVISQPLRESDDEIKQQALSSVCRVVLAKYSLVGTLLTQQTEYQECNSRLTYSDSEISFQSAKSSLPVDSPKGAESQESTSRVKTEPLPHKSDEPVTLSKPPIDEENYYGEAETEVSTRDQSTCTVVDLTVTCGSCQSIRQKRSGDPLCLSTELKCHEMYQQLKKKYKIDEDSMYKLTLGLSADWTIIEQHVITGGKIGRLWTSSDDDRLLSEFDRRKKMKSLKRSFTTREIKARKRFLLEMASLSLGQRKILCGMKGS